MNDYYRKRKAGSGALTLWPTGTFQRCDYRAGQTDEQAPGSAVHIARAMLPPLPLSKFEWETPEIDVFPQYQCLLEDENEN